MDNIGLDNNLSNAKSDGIEMSESEVAAGGSVFSMVDLVHSVQQLSAVINTAVHDITDLKHFVSEHYTTHFAELKSIVVGHQSSLDQINGSLKMIEVIICSTDLGSKSSNPNMNDKACEPTNVVVLDDDDAQGEVNVKRKMPESEKALDNIEDLNNMAIAFSDDEEDSPSKRLCQPLEPLKFRNRAVGPKPTLPDAWTTTTGLRDPAEFANGMAFSKSNYKRTAQNSKKKAESCNQITKRLFHTPSPTQKDGLGLRSFMGSRGKPLVNGSGSGTKRPKSLLPKGIKWNFPVTSETPIDLAELQIIAYVYHPDKDKEKKLFSSNGLDGYRSDFDTLAPGNRINKKILTMVCMRAAWVQKHFNRGVVWYLPPSFRDDVLLGNSMKVLCEKYCKDWMEPYQRLRYFYVPIQTTGDHWYLMVISLQKGIVYHLDTFCDYPDVTMRRSTMSNLCEILQKMMSTPYYGNTFFGRDLAFAEWPIEEARGLQNYAHSNNAAAWLIDFIDMDENFTPDIRGELHEYNIRLRTAAILLLGMYNELKTTIEDEAEKHWKIINNVGV